MNENEFRYQVGKYFNINNELTYTCLEDFGNIPFIHIEIGNDKHIYFRQLREFHTIGTYDDLYDGLIDSWSKHGFNCHYRNACLFRLHMN